LGCQSFSNKQSNLLNKYSVQDKKKARTCSSNYTFDLGVESEKSSNENCIEMSRFCCDFGEIKKILFDQLKSLKSFFESEHKLQYIFIVSFDGGSRGNPGKAGSGCLVDIYLSQSDGLRGNCTLVGTIKETLFLGRATNNVAEYQGLIIGIEHVKNLLEAGFCKDRADINIEIKGDSDLIIKQLNQVYKCKNPGLRPFYEKATGILSMFYSRKNTSVKVRHVYRKDNAKADGKFTRADYITMSGSIYSSHHANWHVTALANEAMDRMRSRTTVGTADLATLPSTPSNHRLNSKKEVNKWHEKDTSEVVFIAQGGVVGPEDSVATSKTSDLMSYADV